MTLNTRYLVLQKDISWCYVNLQTITCKADVITYKNLVAYVDQEWAALYAEWFHMLYVYNIGCWVGFESPHTLASVTEMFLWLLLSLEDQGG